MAAAAAYLTRVPPFGLQTEIEHAPARSGSVLLSREGKESRTVAMQMLQLLLASVLLVQLLLLLLLLPQQLRRLCCGCFDLYRPDLPCIR